MGKLHRIQACHPAWYTSSVLRIVTYNVKDLFDAGVVGDEAHVDAKLAFLAGVLARADADVIGFQEIGSEDLLRALLERVPPSEERGAYGEPIFGTADARGIRCAIATRLNVSASRVHTADALTFPTFFEGDPPPFGTRIPLRRGIVHAEIVAGALGRLHVLVGHFKSNRPVPLRSAAGEIVLPASAHERSEGEMRSLAWRAAEALFVRGLVDKIAKGEAEPKICVMGDLNDGPESLVLRIVTGDDLHPAGALVPPETRYSILVGSLASGRREIDHMLLSGPVRTRLRAARFLNDGLRDHAKLGENVLPIDSDHAPLVAELDS
jgi:endonuclease/exonuclease/phosphatase family metal-dependent hydrolase